MPSIAEGCDAALSGGNMVPLRVSALEVSMPPRPPLAQTVKLELNWTSDGIAVAHNIAYALLGSGGDPTNLTTLLAIGNEVMTAYAASGMPAQLSEHWGLNTCTVSDNSGASENFQISTHARVPGTDASMPTPPQVAVCLSWAIAARYRGGKPRWYLPGITTGALSASYGSAILPSWAATTQGAADGWLVAINGSSAGGSTVTVGTISFRTGNAPRVTPLFRSFTGITVHERLDSQRRRSGKESAFGVG